MLLIDFAFAMLVLLASAVSYVLLLAVVLALGMPVLSALLIGRLLLALRHRPAVRFIFRLAMVLGFVTLLVATLSILASIWLDTPRTYNRTVQTVGIIGGAVTIAGWLGSLLSPPLTRAEFEQAMQPNTEAIKANTAAIAALTEKIDALINQRNANVATPGQPDDIED